MVLLTRILLLLFIPLLLEAQVIRNNGSGSRKGGGGIIRSSDFYGGGGGGGGTVDTINIDNLPSGDRSVTIFAGPNDGRYSLAAGEIGAWYDYYKGGTNPGWDGTTGGNYDTAQVVINGETRIIGSGNATGALISTDHDFLRSETNGWTLFLVIGVNRISTGGNYIMGWRVLSSNYMNITHVSTDTTLKVRGGDGNGHTFDEALFDPAFVTINGESAGPEVMALVYYPAVDSIYGYRSGEKTGISCGASWNPASTWTNSPGSYWQLNAFNGTDHYTRTYDMASYLRALPADTVNSVCAWFADRWNLTWELAQ